jgi:hypothetical protein
MLKSTAALVRAVLVVCTSIVLNTFQKVVLTAVMVDEVDISYFVVTAIFGHYST